MRVRWDTLRERYVEWKLTRKVIVPLIRAKIVHSRSHKRQSYQTHKRVKEVLNFKVPNKGE